MRRAQYTLVCQLQQALCVPLHYVWWFLLNVALQVYLRLRSVHMWISRVLFQIVNFVASHEQVPRDELKLYHSFFSILAVFGRRVD